jgi:dimethylamine--corrinoid protein Co-methyltransferase
MSIAHGVASGMGGIRTAGDLVARMQLTRGMRIKEAKAYVAGKLGVSERDLSDPVVMLDVRREYGLGGLYDSEITDTNDAWAIQAKFNIAELLEIPINCVESFKTLVRGKLGAKS